MSKWCVHCSCGEGLGSERKAKYLCEYWTTNVAGATKLKTDSLAVNSTIVLGDVKNDTGAAMQIVSKRYCDNL